MANFDPSAIITRESFAAFLERHAENKTDRRERDHFIVQHYGDGFLEEIRRCIVRLAINELPIHRDTESTRDLIRSWAFLLRSSTNPTIDRAPDIVTIDMTPSEAVVLDSILRRFSDTDTLVAQTEAERQCLWNIECLLEKHGDRPNWPPIDEAISELSSNDA